MSGSGRQGEKRRATDADAPVLERLELTPLGGGNEVGRSCLILRYKGKTIMLDCGVLPSFQGLESLPWLGEIDPAEVDIVFITHFHLDHAAALPHFTERLSGAMVASDVVGPLFPFLQLHYSRLYRDTTALTLANRRARRLPRAHLCYTRHYRLHEVDALRLRPRDCSWWQQQCRCE